jgi:hypothetical protein
LRNQSGTLAAEQALGLASKEVLAMKIGAGDSVDREIG